MYRILVSSPKIFHFLSSAHTNLNESTNLPLEISSGIDWHWISRQTSITQPSQVSATFASGPSESLVIRVFLGEDARVIASGRTVKDQRRPMPIAREKPHLVSPNRYAESKKSRNNMECVSRDSEDTDFTADTLMPEPQSCAR